MSYRILQLDPVADVLVGIFNPLAGDTIPDALKEAYQSAVDKNLNGFDLDGVSYRITKNKKARQISIEHDVALAMLYVHDSYNQSDAPDVSSYDFKLASSRALEQNKESFVMKGQTFSIRYGEGQATILDAAGNEYAEVSNIIVNPLDKTLFLSVDFKTAIRQAINERKTKFSYTEDTGETIDYTIVRVNKTFNIKKETPIEMIRVFEAPSASHPLGLDNNGMDVMTRLMFGGRVNRSWLALWSYLSKFSSES